jgi:hypothetical protein
MKEFELKKKKKKIMIFFFFIIILSFSFISFFCFFFIIIMTGSLITKNKITAVTFHYIHNFLVLLVPPMVSLGGICKRMQELYFYHVNFKTKSWA